MSASPNLPPEYQPQLVQRPPRSWQSRLLRFCVGIFCLEVGVFLLVFPWMDAWHLNFFSYARFLEPIWDERSFRGAISALGILNLYVALLQFLSSIKSR